MPLGLMGVDDEQVCEPQPGSLAAQKLQKKVEGRTIKLYDLCGAERERRFSAFCWAARMACLHKVCRGYSSRVTLYHNC